MSDLAYSDYRGIAADLRFPERAFIDGSPCASTGGLFFETTNPATGAVLAALPLCGAEDVDRAVSSARRSFRDGAWSRAAPEKRKEVLLRLAELIRRNGRQLAVMESLESGKPITDCLKEITVEVPDIFQWYAELIDKSYGRVAATGEDACALVLREPIGVVAMVLPWNFPLLMASWKLAPALASGCSVIVKPAEETSLTTLYLAQLAVEAGIPAGVFNVLTGPGETTGRLIGQHGDIDAVSFTGSTEVGRLFLQYAASSNLKTIGLEMGGKSPFVVLDDAELTSELIDNAIMAAFWNGGQNCSANMRQIVARARQEEFVEKVVARAKAIRIGDPLDPQTEMGPLISLRHKRRVGAYIETGVNEGARRVLSPENALSKGDDCYLGPTVFADLKPDMTIAREEIFGPVLGVLPADSIDRMLAIANDTDYGLHATVYTRDIDRALYFARRLACGTVAINGFTEGDIKTPFGGYRKSGSLARDKGVEAMAQYQQIKSVWINVSRPEGLS
ncbi:aldehyde dehydrogenase [Agrobacterium vitis]|uniref:aldehyde dehydrogenase n=1 Tax=Agrobacterium vitis TaxID=373 RepID=UPI001F3193CD|nr:aldehyde dehydrogenase [Agrobacterium vitis]MCF1467519.1 aldehyde dehydrogenase [Agrobacterium vitis]